MFYRIIVCWLLLCVCVCACRLLFVFLCRQHVFFSCSYSALSCLAVSRMRIKFINIRPEDHPTASNRVVPWNSGYRQRWKRVQPNHSVSGVCRVCQSLPAHETMKTECINQGPTAAVVRHTNGQTKPYADCDYDPHCLVIKSKATQSTGAEQTANLHRVAMTRPETRKVGEACSGLTQPGLGLLQRSQNVW